MTKHRIEIDEDEYDALINLYEACTNIFSDYMLVGESAKTFTECYEKAREEIEK